jgi:hypothetical protein
LIDVADDQQRPVVRNRSHQGLHRRDVDHRRRVDEGWNDAAKAVAPNGLDYATLQAESCGGDSGGVTSATSVEFDPARRDLDI